MGRIVIKLLSPLYNHSFVLSSIVLHCIYDTTFFVKYLVQLREFLSPDVTGYFWNVA